MKRFIDGEKPLENNEALTVNGGNKARGWGYVSVLGLEPCVDCGRTTTWRDRQRRPRHPWFCDRSVPPSQMLEQAEMSSQ